VRVDDPPPGHGTGRDGVTAPQADEDAGREAGTTDGTGRRQQAGDSRSAGTARFAAGRAGVRARHHALSRRREPPVDHGEARHLTAGGRRASRGQLERWEPRVRAVGAKQAEFTQKDAMPRERQHLRSLVFSALVDSDVLEEIGLTDRRAKVYRLRSEDA
jgi:hypothetical protein